MECRGSNYEMWNYTITSAVKGRFQIGDLNEEKKAGNLYKPWSNIAGYNKRDHIRNLYTHRQLSVILFLDASMSPQGQSFAFLPWLDKLSPDDIHSTNQTN